MQFGFILFIFFISIITGLCIQDDPGYALFVYRDWTLEMPLWLAISIAVAIAMIVLGFLSALRDIEKTVQNIFLWWQTRVQRQREKGQVELQKYCQLLHHMAPQGEKVLLQSWNTLPRDKRRDPYLIQEYAKLLIKQNALQVAEEVLRYALKKSWHSNLIYLYGLTEGKDLEKQLEYAESWLTDKLEDNTLYLTLGRLCIKNCLWGKAKDYLNVSLRLKAMPETYAEMAHLLELTGKLEDSINYYKKGLLIFRDEKKLLSE